MNKHGEFILFPIPDKIDEWGIIIKCSNQLVDLPAGGINLYGKLVKTVCTYEKAYRTVKEYERKMGRIK